VIVIAISLSLPAGRNRWRAAPAAAPEEPRGGASGRASSEKPTKSVPSSPVVHEQLIPADAAGRDCDAAIDRGLWAVPAEYGETGRNTFVIDVTGTVLAKDTGGEPVTAHPGVEAEGWRVVGIGPRGADGI
jgi:hypothetical protein